MRTCVRMCMHVCVRVCMCVILELDSFRKNWPDYLKKIPSFLFMFILFKRTGLTVLLRTVKTILILVLHVLPHPVKVVGRDSLWEITQLPHITEQRHWWVWVKHMLSNYSHTNLWSTQDSALQICSKRSWITANLSLSSILYNVFMLQMNLPSHGAIKDQDRED